MKNDAVRLRRRKKKCTAYGREKNLVPSEGRGKNSCCVFEEMNEKDVKIVTRERWKKEFSVSSGRWEGIRVCAVRRE